MTYYGMFSMNNSNYESLDVNVMFLSVPNFFYSFSILIYHIAIFEFICSQSPRSMKGLMIGVFYAINGVFQLLGALLFMFPFLGWKLSSSFPSCGFAFYLVNVIVGLIGPTHGPQEGTGIDTEMSQIISYRYAEEYYDKGQDEPSSGYDILR